MARTDRRQSYTFQSTGHSTYRSADGQPTFIPLSAGLLREIDEKGAFYLVTDPFGLPYEKFDDDAKMRGHMVTLREQVIKRGGPGKVHDHLRHSAATEAEESGVELDKVRRLTAHKDSAMNREVYVQQSAKITVEIQQKRGLLPNKDVTGGEQESDGKV